MSLNVCPRALILPCYSPVLQWRGGTKIKIQSINKANQELGIQMMPWCFVFSLMSACLPPHQPPTPFPMAISTIVSCKFVPYDLIILIPFSSAARVKEVKEERKR